MGKNFDEFDVATIDIACSVASRLNSEYYYRFVKTVYGNLSNEYTNICDGIIADLYALYVSRMKNIAKLDGFDDSIIGRRDLPYYTVKCDSNDIEHLINVTKELLKKATARNIKIFLSEAIEILKTIQKIS